VPQQEVVEIFMHLLSTWFPVSELELDIGQMHKLRSLLVGDMDLVSVNLFLSYSMCKETRSSRGVRVKK
jgi:hypothetical protein